MIPGVIVSYLYSFVTGFSKLTLDASLVIAVTFFGTAIAATILPWWKRDLYEKSPIVRYAIAGIPLISVAGAITTIFLGFVLFEWLSNALYGIAALVYVVARFYRRSQGVDLDAIHSEIPSE